MAKKRYISKQSNATAVSTDVTNNVSESQCFMSPSILGSSRSAKSSTEWKYNDSCLSLGVMYTGEKIAHDTVCLLCNKVLQNISYILAKLHRHCATNHPEYKDTDMSFSVISLRN